MEKKPITMAALGRPLYPGMLYDCRNDSFIPGVTLWDKSSVDENMEVHPKLDTKFNFSSSDSLSEKAKLLNVSASLKASFMSGLVEVGGSAKYLHDTKSSTRQCRVTLQHSQTTRIEQLTTSRLNNITYPQVFEQKTATHVVTSVVYGAQAYMVFDQTASEDEELQKIQGDLKVLVDKIPTVSIKGEGAVDINEKKKTTVDNISCTFYGDYKLEENPTTYTDALKLYKKLPSLLNENYAVPISVSLYPLVLLDKKAATLVSEMNENLVYEIEHLLEELAEVERRYNDLDRNVRVDDFHSLKDRLRTFKDVFREYKVTLQRALRKFVPAIRAGTEDIKSLNSILKLCSDSPFAFHKLTQWLDKTKTELELMCAYAAKLKGIQFLTSSESFEAIHFSPRINVVVCLNFNSLEYDDNYLSTLKLFLLSEDFEKLPTSPSTVTATSSQALQSSVSSSEISQRINSNISLFKSFSEANKDTEGIQFFITFFEEPCNPGCSIHLYEKGKLVDDQFQPPSKPPAPIVENLGGNISLKLVKSPTAKTVKFRIEYRKKEAVDSKAKAEPWVVIDTKDAQETFTLTELQTGVPYLIRYRVIGEVGVSEASQDVCYTSHSGKISVGSWGNLTMFSFVNKLRKAIMTGCGPSRWSQSIIQSEVTNLLSDINIPYVCTVPTIRPGMAFFLQGVVNGDAESFSVNYKTEPKENADIAFHFNPRIDKVTICNSFNNQIWGSQEWIQGCPLNKGSAFGIFVVIEAEGYKVHVNGQSFYIFKHRMPVEKVTTLQIDGDVVMSTVGVIENWSTSSFSKEQTLGVTRRKLSNIQSEVQHPVCNPSKPYLGPFPQELRPGLGLFFQGVVPSDSTGFQIDQMSGDRDIAFCFCVKFDPSFVELKRLHNGMWDSVEKSLGGPFVKGGAFDLLMLLTSNSYEVFVNGQVCYRFPHHTPLKKVSRLKIHGDVFMNTFGIFEVDHVTLKAILPAHI